MVPLYTCAREITGSNTGLGLAAVLYDDFRGFTPPPAFSLVNIGIVS